MQCYVKQDVSKCIQWNGANYGEVLDFVEDLDIAVQKAIEVDRANKEANWIRVTILEEEGEENYFDLEEGDYLVNIDDKVVPMDKYFFEKLYVRADEYTERMEQELLLLIDKIDKINDIIAINKISHEEEAPRDTEFTLLKAQADVMYAYYDILYTRLHYTRGCTCKGKCKEKKEDER